MIKLTVITITFNDLHGLIQTFESIDKQTSNDFEWIIVDGGSSDGTLGYIQECGRVSNYISEPDDGIYDAMKKGLMLAKGEYVLFLNSGDALASGESVEFFFRNEDGKDVYFYSTRVKGFLSPYIRRAKPLSYARYSVPAIQQSTVYRKAILTQLEWPLDYRICGDYAIAAQLYAGRYSSSCFDFILSEFALGGVSTKRFFPLAFEAMSIQRKYITHSNLFLFLMFARRVFSGVVVRLGNSIKS